MMNREMMEEIFRGVCNEYDMAWYEVFDGDMMKEVNSRICSVAGWTMEELEDNDDWCDWTGDMAMDL